jgi:purine-binding chemotaxis protein CheW
MSEHPDQGPRGAATAHHYILLSVAGTTYAVPSDRVEHMEMVEQVTGVPKAAAFVEGVVFSRGHVVPVINLRVRFGFERVPRDLRTRMLVVQHGGRRVGLMADEAREFIMIDTAAVRPPGESIGGLSGDYVAGVATLGERIVLVLDVGEVVERAPLAAA